MLKNTIFETGLKMGMTLEAKLKNNQDKSMILCNFIQIHFPVYFGFFRYFNNQDTVIKKTVRNKVINKIIT